MPSFPDRPRQRGITRSTTCGLPTLKLQSHPTFGKSLQHTFVRFFILPVLFFAGALIASKSGFSVIGGTLAVGFGLFVVGLLGLVYYRLFNVECPTCGRVSKTTKDSRRRCWVARCDNCDTTWDLGVGARRTGI